MSRAHAELALKAAAEAKAELEFEVSADVKAELDTKRLGCHQLLKI